jgi:hypothetical protein
MAYTAKDYAKLIGMPGFSDTILKNHFTLYQGYVTNTNKVLDALAQMAKDGKAGTPEYAELKRRQGWEWNGMRLHEAYFENLGGKKALDSNGKLAKKLAESFGSVEAWEKEFRATGAMRGIGWVVLYEDPANGRARRQPPGRRPAPSRHGRFRACLHDRLRPQAGRLHRGLFQEHRLGGGRGQAHLRGRDRPREGGRLPGFNGL